MVKDLDHQNEWKTERAIATIKIIDKLHEFPSPRCEDMHRFGSKTRDFMIESLYQWYHFDLLSTAFRLDKAKTI